MQLPAERRDDVSALLQEGVIRGQLTYYFPVAGEPSADLSAEAWVNLTLAAIGGAARLGRLAGPQEPGDHSHTAEVTLR